MIDETTGQPFTGAALYRVAKEVVYPNIVSEGALNRTPGQAGRSAMANRMGEHRFIHYKSYDDWKASREQFGRGTAYDAMMGHIKGMSRNVAAMELLGPNPETGVRFMRDVMTGDETLYAPDALRTRDTAEGQSKVVQRLWDEYRGALRQPENRNLALGFWSIARSPLIEAGRRGHHGRRCRLRHGIAPLQRPAAGADHGGLSKVT